VAGSFGAKEQGPAKFEKFSGIFGVLLGCLEWLVPNRNYFSKTEGPATILPTTRDRVLIYKKLGGFFVQFVRFNGTRIISQWYNPWTGSTALWTGGVTGSKVDRRWHVVRRALWGSGACWRRPERKRTMRRCWLGAHRSSNDGGEVAPRQQKASLHAGARANGRTRE
jgi:hypothetical protein